MSAPARIITPRLEAAITKAVLLLDELAKYGAPDTLEPTELRAELLEAFEEARADAVR